MYLHKSQTLLSCFFFVFSLNLECKLPFELKICTKSFFVLVLTPMSSLQKEIECKFLLTKLLASSLKDIFLDDAYLVP